MTIKVAATRNEFIASAGQTIFNYTFKIFANTDLNVFVTPAGQSCSDSADLTTAFTVSGVGNEDGGAITLTVATSAGDLVTIVSDIPATRTTDYQNNGDFIPQTVNDDFDRVVSLVKQVEELSNRTLISAECQQGVKPLTLDEPKAGLFLKWKLDETGVESSAVPALLINPVESSTVSSMVAASNIKVGDVVVTVNRATSGDGGGATYDVVLTSTVTPNTFDIIVSSADPSISFVLRIKNATATFVEFGAVGNDAGVTDNALAMQAAFDNADVRTLLGLPGDIYSSTDTLTMQVGTTLDLNNATIRFKIIGKKRCLVTKNFCTVRNFVIDNATTDATLHGAEFQQPICIGFSNSIDPADAPHDVLIENGSVLSSAPEGNGIFCFGAVDNILVQNVEIKSTSKLGEPIGGHWSAEPGGDETLGTGHPNNITFKNITIGAQSFASGKALCFLSACRAVTLENITCDDFFNGEIINVFAGDHGFTFAIDPLAEIQGTVLSAKNVTGKALSGISIQMRDTLNAQIVWASSLTFENCSMQSRSTASSASKGFRIGSVDGVMLKNCYFSDFFNSVFLDSSVTNLTVKYNTFKDSFKSGVDADNSLGSANLRFIGNKFDNSKASGSGTEHDMFFGSFIDNILLDGNTFNSPNVNFNVFAETAAPPSNMKVINNHVEASGGTNFVFGGSASFGICELFNGNTQAETVTNNIRGGQDLVPYANTGQQNSKLPTKHYIGGGTPSFGTYNASDIVYDETPSASGKIGSICTTSGTQGTYTEGRTATTDGTTTVVLSASSDVLRKGDYLTINATNVRVTSITGTTMITDVTVPTGSGLAITYFTSTFKLWGAINA